MYPVKPPNILAVSEIILFRQMQKNNYFHDFKAVYCNYEQVKQNL
jgi:hypothetical protein